MSKFILYSFLLFTLPSLGQSKKEHVIKMTSEYLSDHQDVSDLMFFQNIAFYKLKFEGAALNGATFKIISKEIWDGKITEESILTNSAEIDFKDIAQIKGDTFSMKVLSMLTADNELKMSFKFPRYGTTKKYKAIKSDDYSLRNIIENTNNPIIIDQKFYLFAYILPYEKEGAKYWCAVESSGADIENWGKEFNIKHYLVFEMIFESTKPTTTIKTTK